MKFLLAFMAAFLFLGVVNLILIGIWLTIFMAVLVIQNKLSR